MRIGGNRLWGLLLAPILLCCLASAATAAGHFDDPDAAVEGGRKALGRWRGYPWYDSQTDSLHRLKVNPPKPRRNWNFGWDWPALTLPMVGWTSLVVLLCVVAYLIVRAFLDRETLIAASSRSRIATDTTSHLDRLEALPLAVQRSQSDLRGEALRQYQQGNFAEAIVYLFSHQLVELDKNQIIRLARGKTNRQYLREAHRRPAVGDLLQLTMVAFEDVFFGKHPLSRARFEACWNRMDEFHRHIVKATL